MRFKLSSGPVNMTFLFCFPGKHLHETVAKFGCQPNYKEAIVLFCPNISTIKKKPQNHTPVKQAERLKSRERSPDVDRLNDR